MQRGVLVRSYKLDAFEPGKELVLLRPGSVATHGGEAIALPAHGPKSIAQRQPSFQVEFPVHAVPAGGSRRAGMLVLSGVRSLAGTLYLDVRTVRTMLRLDAVFTRLDVAFSVNTAGAIDGLFTALLADNATRAARGFVPFELGTGELPSLLAS